jgi:hypothetical protein
MTRAGDKVPDVFDRRMMGFSKMELADDLGSSGQIDKVGVRMVAIVVPDSRRS